MPEPITLLDGGMGQELIRRAASAPTPLWSTGVMRSEPHLVADIHRDFFAAGATVATANTYAIHRDRLQFAGIEEEFAHLHDVALTAAETARAAALADRPANAPPLRIAGAIGPLRNSYRPDLHPADDEAAALYGEVARLLAPRVDLIVIETAASLLNARSALAGALAGAATKTDGDPPPVWLAVTVDDEDGTRLRSGEAVADLLPILRDGAAAVLVNCSAPEAVPAALDALAPAGLPLGGYANAFTGITKEFLQVGATVEALSTRRDMGPERYADHALQWIDHGATILGGCCEVSPAHIAELYRRLGEAGYPVV